MTIIKAWLVVVLMLFGGQVVAEENESIHVASFNVHYIVPSDSDENWLERRDAVRDVIGDINADVIAFQEMETFTGGNYSAENLQLNWVLTHFPKYKAGAVGDPAIFPDTQPILYDQEKFILIDQGFLFFSDTPSVIYSRQWDGGYPYFLTWVELKDLSTDQSFIVVNLHNDYNSRSNRLASTRVLSDTLGGKLQQMPAVVLGDFNAPKSFKEVTLLADYGLKPVSTSGSTNRIFGLRLLPAIDHILHSNQFSALTKITRWKDKYNGVYPSDHFPISVRLAWQ